MAKICFIGKYPPIEGGVSSQTFWLCRVLAEAGHEIHVVTNAWEVEEAYRIYLSGEDLDWFKEFNTPSGGRVFVHNTNPFLRPKFIPSTQPYVSKLTSKAIEVIKEFKCDFVWAYYLEPYGVAGFIVSSLLKLPFIFKHAGSDVSRLLPCPDMKEFYANILDSADCILSTSSSAQKINSFLSNSDSNSIQIAPNDYLPKSIFSPEGNKLPTLSRCFLIKNDLPCLHLE